MSALKAAIREQMYEALQETTEDSFLDLKNNVNHFYESPESSRYRRTNQLRDSPQEDGINFNDDSAVAQLSINTSTQYPEPVGRSTDIIYGYAESGGLLGNGNFWQKTQDDIERNIEESFGKRFD